MGATTMIQVTGLSKTFTLHVQSGVRLPVFSGLQLEVHRGECLALCGPSGSGKSTLLRSLYGNYAPTTGSIRVRHNGLLTELAGAPPRTVLDVRRRTIGYVSQFLRVIPRVAALDVVAAGLGGGMIAPGARERAASLLRRLNIPERLHRLSPMTFSGGEQQRVNIARGFLHRLPILLLDEPTASLDPANREVVLELIQEAKAAGTAIVGIFHDAEARQRVADRLFTLHPGDLPC